MSQPRYRQLVASLIGITALLTAAASPATAGPASRAVSVPEAIYAAAAPTAPTNLRVTGLTPTSVTLQWDHSQGAQPGCTLQLILYAVYLNGRFVGWTYLGSPVGHVGGLRPGTAYRLAVQGRDNCSGQLSPLSASLRVTTPRR